LRVNAVRLCSFREHRRTSPAPPEEKLKIIETLWGDLATDEASFSSPIWHGDKLKSTEVEFAAGQIEVMAWAEAKKELRQRFE
jgi:hypothetical protein